MMTIIIQWVFINVMDQGNKCQLESRHRDTRKHKNNRNYGNEKRETKHRQQTQQ
jgi:hypothetical protein